MRNHSLPAAFVAVLCLAGVLRAQGDKTKLMMNDQVFDENQVKYVKGTITGSNLSHPSAAAGFLESGGKPWPGGVLPIEFPRGVSTQQAEAFAAACDAWGRASGARCVPHTNQSDHLKVLFDNDDNTCNSTIGNHGDILGFDLNRMHLGKNCWTMGIIAHELGHAFGLLHEHQRYSRTRGFDRDDFIVVNTQNMIDNASVRMNLSEKIHNSLIPFISATPYDCESIMHYARTAYSKNGNTTMDPKPGVQGCDRAGWRSWYCNSVDCLLSSSDKQFMSQLYGRPKNSGPAPAPAPAPEPDPDQPAPPRVKPDPAPETPDSPQPAPESSDSGSDQ
jgi:hypothetical protein